MQDAPDVQIAMSEGYTSVEQAAAVHAEQKKIPLMEMFGPTIQGEGTVIGQQTYFLRFGACDYRCKMCDSLHAVLPALVNAHAKWLTQDELFEQFRYSFYKDNTTTWVTFSGGNPALHDLTYLTHILHQSGFKINVETQGTYYRPWLNHVDSLTISPKGPGMGEKHDHKVFMEFIDKVHKSEVSSWNSPTPWSPKLCVKIVVFDQRDLEFAGEVFNDLMNHDLFLAEDYSDVFYLSLGNPYPPNPASADVDYDHGEHMKVLSERYRMLWEDIQHHPVLRNVRFLPQWHVFVWGNAKGK